MDTTFPASPTPAPEPPLVDPLVMAGHWQQPKSEEYRTYQRLYQRKRYLTERRREEKKQYYLRIKDRLASDREYKRASLGLLRVLV